MIVTIDEFLKMKLKDEVFIIETDTVYGLGSLYDSKAAADKIMKIKNRSKDKFFSLLVSNLNQVESLTLNYKDSIDIMNEYWPGALTLIFKKSNLVKDFVSPTDTVGLRMPDNKNTLMALEKFGPMIMTSLNYSGEPPILKFEDCLKFENLVDFIVVGGDLNGVPSTVYDIENAKVLRQGSVFIK